MQFQYSSAEIFVPDGLPSDQALTRTTHLGISAHQDDLEIMAAAPIITCFQQPDLWFSGAVVTDGRGSPRDGAYRDYSDDDMHIVRFKEQKKAAVVGEYAAQVLLDYPSSRVKDGSDPALAADIVTLLRASKPKFVYTHNLADKHDTHVAVALRVIDAIRTLPEAERPQKLYGCEVWRGLDWMVDQDKVILDLTAHENLQMSLLGVYDSQIAGGKRYDLASMGRRRANATYFEAHGVDDSLGLSFCMDLTPIVSDPCFDIAEYVDNYILRFSVDVAARLRRMG